MSLKGYTLLELVVRDDWSSNGPPKKGFNISGSDLQMTEELSSLKALGAKVQLGMTQDILNPQMLSWLQVR